MISDRRVIAGVVLLVAAAVVGLALWPDRHDPRVYEAEGGFAVGTITAVDGGRVEVRYRLRGEERHAGAYPELGGPYAEGQVVELRALADRPDRVVIAGTEVAPRTADTLWWLAAVRRRPRPRRLGGVRQLEPVGRRPEASLDRRAPRGMKGGGGGGIRTREAG